MSAASEGAGEGGGAPPTANQAHGCRLEPVQHRNGDLGTTSRAGGKRHREVVSSDSGVTGEGGGRASRRRVDGLGGASAGDGCTAETCRQADGPAAEETEVPQPGCLIIGSADGANGRGASKPAQVARGDAGERAAVASGGHAVADAPRRQPSEGRSGDLSRDESGSEGQDPGKAASDAPGIDLGLMPPALMEDKDLLAAIGVHAPGAAAPRLPPVGWPSPEAFWKKLLEVELAYLRRLSHAPPGMLRRALRRGSARSSTAADATPMGGWVGLTHLRVVALRATHEHNSTNHAWAHANAILVHYLRDWRARGHFDRTTARPVFV